MSNVTLIMSRIPLEEISRFSGSKQVWTSGRWGTMIVVKGAQILTAGFAAASDASSTGFTLAGKPLYLKTKDNSQPELVAEFDTMERFRFDGTKTEKYGKGFYMQVKPRPNQPYELIMSISKRVTELNKSGNCLRVQGHGYKQQGSGAGAGILIHEALHIGFVIGCISPREKNNRSQDNDRGSSRRAMDIIFKSMGNFAVGKKANLFVLDW